MAIDSSRLIGRFGLVIALQDKQRTYTVTAGDKSFTLVEFCKRIGLQYNSVVQAINRRSWTAGVYLHDWHVLVTGLVNRANRGTIKCPCCHGNGRIKAKYERDGSGIKLTPQATITWASTRDESWHETTTTTTEPATPEAPTA